MRNIEQWVPSKYVLKGAKLVASSDRAEVSIASRLLTNRVAAAYQRHLSQYCHGRLLDLGCGRVPLYVAYRQFVNINICVDWANTLHGKLFLDFECDLRRPLPFRDSEFDVVVLSDVLEHIPTPEALLREIARVLVSDGTLMMSVPFLYWVHETPHDYYRYTEFGLRYLLGAAGLDVVVVERLGGIPEVIADLLAKGLINFPVVGRSIANAVQGVCDLLGRFHRFAHYSQRSSEIFPLAYFVVARKRHSG
jgi:SAM-dependent methyltransferase